MGAEFPYLYVWKALEAPNVPKRFVGQPLIYSSNLASTLRIISNSVIEEDLYIYMANDCNNAIKLEGTSGGGNIYIYCK